MKELKIIKAIDELRGAILNDKGSRDLGARRFCVRFLLLKADRIKEYRDMLRELSIDSVPMEELLEQSETKFIPTGSEIFTAISRVIETKGEVGEVDSICIGRLTQCLRLLSIPEIMDILTRLSELEVSKPSLRVYIPFVDFKECIVKFWDNYHRRGERVAPWELTEGSQQSNKRRCLMLNRSIKLSDKAKYPTIITYGDWLKIYEREEKKFVCLNENISREGTLNDYRGSLAVKYIKTYKDLIEVERDTFYDSIRSWEHDDEFGEYWKRLYDASYEYSDITTYIGGKDMCNKAQLDDEAICSSILLGKDSFYVRWVLIMYTINNSTRTTSYLHRVCCNVYERHRVGSIVSREGFFKSLYSTYLWERPKELHEEFIQERNKLLSACQTYRYSGQLAEELKEDLENFFGDDKSIDSRWRVITGEFNFETEFLLARYSCAENIDKLKTKLPKLANYLDLPLESKQVKYENPISWVKDYFDEYRRSKLCEKASLRLQRMLEEHNAKDDVFWKWYYSSGMETTLNQHGAVHKDKDMLIWVDGLGAEWLPYVLNNLAARGDVVLHVYLTVSELPTTTGVFKTRYNNAVGDIREATKFDHLDKAFHDEQVYRFPSSFIREVRALDTILVEINRCIDQRERLLIFSDHGATIFSRYQQAAHLNIDADHEGRCTDDFSGMLKEDPYGITTKNEEDSDGGKYYYMARSHVSLVNTPRREVHGGCTPEEVIVPFLVIERSTDVPPIAPGKGTVSSENDSVKEDAIKPVLTENDIFDD